MELGNMFWGNSRGNYGINRDWQDTMVDILDALNCDRYGCYCGDDKSLINDRGGITTEHFIVRPYYWGEDEELAELPNFEFHFGKTHINIDWYKYPLRDSYSNIKITKEMWMTMVVMAKGELNGKQVYLSDS